MPAGGGGGHAALVSALPDSSLSVVSAVVVAVVVFAVVPVVGGVVSLDPAAVPGPSESSMLDTVVGLVVVPVLVGAPVVVGDEPSSPVESPHAHSSREPTVRNRAKGRMP